MVDFVAHIGVILVLAALKERVLEVFFYATLKVGLVVDTDVEHATLSIEEGAYFLHNLMRLTRRVGMHGVGRTDDRRLELLGERLLTVILLRILFFLQLQ